MTTYTKSQFMKLAKSQLVEMMLEGQQRFVAMRDELADTKATVEALRAEIEALRNGDQRSNREKVADFVDGVKEGVDKLGRRVRVQTFPSAAEAAAQCRKFATSSFNKGWSFCAKGATLTATRRAA